jgi:hypothetical protein
MEPVAREIHRRLNGVIPNTSLDARGLNRVAAGELVCAFSRLRIRRLKSSVATEYNEFF